MAVRWWTVPATAQGTRIDLLLATLLSEPRSRTQGRLERGEITVDGVGVAKSYRVRGGESVAIAAPEQTPPAPPPPPVAVLYEDADLVVVAKPADLVVHAGAGGVRDPTLVAALTAMGVPLAAGDDPTRPGIVHRLDRGTSGALVVAKSAAALRGLREQFARHDVDRRYWALVEGVPQPAEAVIAAPIARHPTNRKRFQTAADGRAAQSRYRVLERFGRASSVEVRLETGRTHQVRVHLSALGHPVCGDQVYGASAALAAELGLLRPALHAAHLGFAHPVTGEPVAIADPLPADLSAARDRLRASRR